MTSTVSPGETGLEALINGFERDPLASQRALNNLLESDHERFYASAVDILKGQPESRGAHYVIGLLAKSGLLLRALCDPMFEPEQGLYVGRAAIGIDATIDIKLARILSERGQPGEDVLSPTEAARVLEILTSIAPISRLLPFLVRLLRHSDPYLRSKAVLLLGRANASARWSSQRLTDPDARIRANAVEALWDVKSDGVRDVLKGAATDWNNRVAANAMLGLYRLGDSSSIPEILAMAANQSELFRSSSAWIMGETKSARFQEPLASMLRDSRPVVRRRAFTALL